jgi:hypothetical protein
MEVVVKLTGDDGKSRQAEAESQFDATGFNATCRSSLQASRL